MNRPQGLRSGEEFAYHGVEQRANCVRAIALSRYDAAVRGDLALWRRIASALILLSFFWISYVSQTHIHGQPPTPAAASSLVKLLQVHGGGTASDHHNSDDSADCPLCQAVGLTGAVIIPILAVLLLAQNVVLSVLPRTVERIGPSHFGLAHQTRGPPTL